MKQAPLAFEWDENKNELNIARHGFDFADAQFFFDSPILAKIDDRQDYGEERFIAFGELEGRVVTLVYTMRRVTICRIISLRRATANEKRTYYSWIESYEK